MKLKHQHIFLILLLAVFAAYGNSLSGQFIWDDKPLIADSPLVKSPHLWGRAFSSELYENSRANYYRPLVVISFILNSVFSGTDPFGYHLVNIILHFGVGCLLYLFLTRMGAGSFVPFATAMIFLVHPLHAQVVTYISGRADSLSAIFILSSLIFFKKAHECRRERHTNPSDRIGYRRNMILSCFMFILALLTKETAIVLPFVLCWERPFLKKARPLFCIALIYAVLRISLLNFSFGNPFLQKKGFAFFEVGIFERLFIFGKTLLIYLGSFMAPFGLHMERLTAYENIIPEYWVGILCALMLVGVGIKNSRAMSLQTKQLAPYFLFWFFAWLFPQSALIFPMIMAEHFLYLPSMALCFYVAVLLQAVTRPGLRWAILSAVVLFLAFLSWQNNKDWSNELRFFQKTVSLSPYSIRARDSLASLYLEQNRYNDAELEYKRILGLKSTFAGHPGADVVEASAYYNIGILYEKTGRVIEAVLAYRAAIMVNPKMEKAYNNIGLLYQRMGDVSKAQESFKKAIELDGGFYQAYNNLATLYVQRGDNNSAMGLWQKALLIKPDYETARKNIALVKELVKKD
ncbi:MAG: tetratricopeptide repeat protein [Candidatus Omnitrophota bacterium]